MKGETYYEKDRRKSNELPQLRMLSVRVFRHAFSDMSSKCGSLN